MPTKKIALVVMLIILAILGYFLLKSKSSLPQSLSQIPTPNLQNTQKTPKEAKNDTNLKVPEGFSATVFALNQNGARDLEVTEGGTLIVSLPSSGKIVALPDKDANGKADEAKTLIQKLDRPHGIAVYKGALYVAEETRVSRYFLNEQDLTATLDKKLFDLPKGGRHFTRTIVFDDQGKMYVTVGSTCDVCYEKDQFISTVLISDSEGIAPRVYARGLRNAVFIIFDPQTKKLMATEMGRDFLGDNLPPDEINVIQDGKDYGWPICYGNRIHDTNFDKNVYTEDPCSNTEPPAFEIPAHSAPLGLQIVKSDKFPKDWQGDLLISYHGSWNSTVPTGYKVVRVKMENGKLQNSEDFITGFISGRDVSARPVDLVFDKSGSLFVSDDKSGNIFKIDGQN